MKIFQKIIFITLLLSISFSCTSSNKKDEKASAELSYTKAKQLLDEKAFSQAAEEFEKIDTEFPFSKWAIKGQTMAVYARYQEKDYLKLIEIVDDFVRLNPASEYTPYMIYMKGLSYYDQIPEITRAQDETQKASFTFRELIARFSDTKYSQDAKTKLPFITEHLAGAKMETGRYQIEVRNYIGAISHFNLVSSRYRMSDQAPEALFRLTEIYYRIGMEKEGQLASKQLRENYSESSWAKQVEELDLNFGN